MGTPTSENWYSLGRWLGETVHEEPWRLMADREGGGGPVVVEVKVETERCTRDRHDNKKA